MRDDDAIKGQEHWTTKGDVRLFLWEKAAVAAQGSRGTILFVHGSSMASTPTFDLQVPGQPDRSAKHRDINCDIANGADDVAAASAYIMRTRGVARFLVYGISSGALRAALFAERHPERVQRLALDAFVWTGRGSPTLADRRKRLAEEPPADRARVRAQHLRA